MRLAKKDLDERRCEEDDTHGNSNIVEMPGLNKVSCHIL